MFFPRKMRLQSVKAGIILGTASDRPRIGNDVSCVFCRALGFHFSWQGQYLVKLELQCHLSWLGQSFVKLQSHFRGRRNIWKLEVGR